MGEQILLTEEQREILEYVDLDNNQLAEFFANKYAKEKWYANATDMYISELYEMKLKIKDASHWEDWWTPQLIKEWRAINNEIEQIVWMKKNNNALYLLNEIREKWENLYLK